jgi:hypothetical protein
MRKVNYLNNKDILKEIHKSKKTYCSYLDKEADSDYDMILYDVNKITKKNILEARKARAERLGKLTIDAFVAEGIKKKLDEVITPLKDINAEDVVFRVMTFEHIPIDDVKQAKADLKAVELAEDDEVTTEYDDEPSKAKGINKYVKINFPPFFHYRVDAEGVPYIAGKSHWKGGVEKGKFSTDHGAMTNKLAHMFIKLCERYATRSNWRGYTYNDEMRSQALLQLSQIGLQFDEFKSQNPFAYYTAAITNSFTRVLNIEKRNQNIRDDILEMNNFAPSYTRQNSGFSGGSDD